jgi:hypothetical protein
VGVRSPAQPFDRRVVEVPNQHLGHAPQADSALPCQPRARNLRPTRPMSL